jgi:hypothetical protein
MRGGIPAQWAKLSYRQKNEWRESDHDLENECIEALAENDNRRDAWSL